MKIDYNEPALNYEDQVNHFMSLGLKPKFENNLDMVAFEGLLKKYGMQTIKKYVLPFFEIKKCEDIYFQDICNLLAFEHGLINIIFRQMAVFELQFRENWSYELSMKYGVDAHKKEVIYRDKQAFYESVARIFKSLESSKDDRIVYMRNKYNIETLPIYLIKDVMTFGELSRNFGNLKNKGDLDLIASKIGFYDGDVCKSWLQHFVEVRNVIAHHGVLWNRKFKFKPLIPRTKPLGISVNFDNSNSELIYNTLTMLQFLKRRRSESELSKLVKNPKYSAFLPAMGFPADWRDKPLWQNL